MTTGAITANCIGRRLTGRRVELYLAALLSCIGALLTGAGLIVVAASVFTVDLVDLPLAERCHVALNIGCTWLIAAVSWRGRGQLEEKLTQVLTSTIVVYGVFFLCILGARLSFSRGLLLASFSAALALSFLVVLLKHSLNQPRLGIIDPLGSLGYLGRTGGERISDPDTDLRPYDILLVSFTDTVDAAWARAISRAMLAGATVRHVGEYVEDRQGIVALDHFDVEQVPDFSLASYRHLKRFVDIAAVTLSLPIALPIIAVAGVLITLTTGASPVFVQERVGLGGKIFRIWKLRTMSEAACRSAHVRAAVTGDLRITPIGGVLRRLHIDELPQLWNVLKGDMTLVGPRPEAVNLHETYLRDTPTWAYRTLVRPGITGWAQVRASPSSNVEEAKRKLTYDLYYVKRMSILLDLQIALRTLWTITRGARSQ